MSAALGVVAAGVVVTWLRRPAATRLVTLEPASGRGRSSDPRARLLAALERLWPARRARARDRQLPDLLERMSTALRAGQGMAPAFVEAARSALDPLGTDLEGIAAAVGNGAPLSDALSRWAAGPTATDAVRLATSALLVGAAAGGQVARAVDRVAATLRERHELEREVHALATQARASAVVLAGAPVAFTLLVATIDPRAVRFLVASPVGLACLVAGFALEAVGMAWMARIVRSAA